MYAYAGCAPNPKGGPREEGEGGGAGEGAPRREPQPRGDRRGASAPPPGEEAKDKRETQGKYLYKLSECTTITLRTLES